MKEYISLYLGLVCGYMYHLLFERNGRGSEERRSIYTELARANSSASNPQDGKEKKHIAHKIMTVCLFNAWDVSSAGIERDTASLQQEV